MLGLLGTRNPAWPLEEHHMDAEHINQIGSLLADLSARAKDLRGYL
jgi:hypothetical protein